MEYPTEVGWYVYTSAGYAGPYRWREDAKSASLGYPVVYMTDCGCGGQCDPGSPCPMRTDVHPK